MQGLNSTVHHLHRGGSDIVLVPQPSKHPNDPLNWAQWKKQVIFINVCSFAFFTNFSIGGITPAFYVMSLEFEQSINSISHLLNYPILLLGIGNFFWVPMAIYFGKRPVFVVSSLLLCITNIWGATSTSYHSLLNSRFIAGFAGSSTEALGAAIINDLFFLHERGFQIGIYIIFLSCGNSVGPLLAGFVDEKIGWRWFYWVMVIFTASNFLSVLFLVPETRYERHFGQENDENNSKNPVNTVQHDIKSIPTHCSEVPSPSKMTYFQSLRLFSGVPRTNLINLFVRPFPLIAYPAVMWAFLSYSICLACVIASGTLNPFVLQAPPYLFSSGIQGLINIPAIIGNLVGAVCGGYLTDIYSARYARKNDGYFLPESRLVLCIIPTVLTGSGLLMFGFGCDQTSHWAVIYVGYGLINTGLTGIASIGMTYVMDSYYPIAAEALLLVNGLKNIVAFGFLYGIVPWWSASGFAKMYGALTGIFIAIAALGIPLYLFGAKIRHFTSSRFKVISW
ncbi:major facilitator superfamily domain-containing protein [Talaromyces proteolyticus]|uniref:Major facilitator superfamily domain-containing protein n=1 Tax=Talaromyces proteolyticus TaxID=1131652 RepID=A0AAD4L1M5_9EURO|nr:major facilitator superfamily domain-containing protein [Talaromyces proteolyticus]KAH8702210.1 major facilitator superfamily domain-containing protein [Talaromyces proteolyticus]